MAIATTPTRADMDGFSPYRGRPGRAITDNQTSYYPMVLFCLRHQRAVPPLPPFSPTGRSRLGKRCSEEENGNNNFGPSYWPEEAARRLPDFLLKSFFDQPGEYSREVCRPHLSQDGAASEQGASPHEREEEVRRYVLVTRHRIRRFYEIPS